ncbi:hypothetical protein [Kribbella sp. NPDC049584]|uniref:hypothetical protein n=1 Tax=Kribbella sp. NPDC049584 TaxID=3154833 RepID=UPI003419F700
MSVAWNSGSAIVQLPVAQGSEMKPGQALYPGDTLVSPNGKYTLAFQGDGNLVVYGPASSVVWASGTTGRPVGVFLLDGDTGRLKIYGPGMQLVWEKPATGPNAPSIVGADLIVQDDGNLVLAGEAAVNPPRQ